MKKAFSLTLTMALLCILPSLSHATTATLRWQANKEADLAGYKVYYGKASRSYGSPITVGKVTNHTLTGLSAGTYYFAVTAFDTSGNESGFSGEVRKTISTSTPPPSGGISPRIGADFNGNGLPDILWRDYSSGRNYVWFMDGVKRTGTAELPSLSDRNWRIVGTGDFNRDGSVDILWRNTADGRNMVWYMKGTTRTGVADLPEVKNTSWRIEGTGDFNKDGHVDIVWRHYGTGTNLIWLMNGVTLTKQDYLNYTVKDPNWRIAGTGDFNKDGHLDILWRHYGTGDLGGRVAVWLMNGTTCTQGVYLDHTVKDLGWRIVGTGDFNKNGNVDILWRHYGTGSLGGRNAVWIMNGTTCTQGVYLENDVSNIQWESLS
jgi:hypothetical protein